MADSAPGNSSKVWVLAACIAGLSVSYSAIFLVTFSVFLQPVERDLGWSRGSLSILLSVANVSLAVATPIVGNLIGRFGVRLVLPVSVLSFAAALALLAAAPASFPLFIIIAAILGAAGAGSNTFVYLSVLPHWFTERLGLALGVAMMGIGIGQAVMPIAAQYLVDVAGWRQTYLVLATLSVVVALPGALLVLGRTPSGDNTYVQRTERGIDRRTAMTKASFWLFCAAFFVIALAASGCAIHAVPMLIERGLTPMQAASYGAMGGVAVLVGRLGAGYLLDVVGPGVIGTVAFCCAVLAPLVYLSPLSASLLFLAPVMLGFAIGVEGDLMPYVVRRVYGMLDYEVIYSRVFTAFTAGVVLGPVVMGVGYDRIGSYTPLLIFLSALAAAAVPTFIIGLRQTRVVGR